MERDTSYHQEKLLKYDWESVSAVWYGGNRPRKSSSLSSGIGPGGKGKSALSKMISGGNAIGLSGRSACGTRSERSAGFSFMEYFFFWQNQ